MLVQLDSKLGTTASEQLFRLLGRSLRMDLLKVSLQLRNMRLKLFKVINMSEVDFDYQENGRTIYINCFHKLANGRNISEIPKTEWVPLPEWNKLVTKLEAVFEFLVEQGNTNGFNVDSILEKTDPTGETCFARASITSRKICYYILDRSIQVNSINTRMMVPDFWYADLTVRMMEKGIKPHIIDYKGSSSVDRFSSNFESDEAKLLLSQIPRSVHFSIEDINCGETCPVDCSSELKRFFCKNGPLVEMNDKNRIGSGGFGMVFKQLFHGRLMAMKCVWTGELEEPSSLDLPDVLSVFDENITEIRTQTSSVGPGILVPEAFVRQQDQEQDENGKWLINNYNIFIYPRYDCNLYELHKKHYNGFTDEVLRNILSQCLVRKCSNR